MNTMPFQDALRSICVGFKELHVHNWKAIQYPDMIPFCKFINNILREHHSLDRHTWELAGF